ncbi:hypothetical protein PF003_g11798 [Phytophthora fragariae]|nr:hypothetical protein PF003_g11798 [Phytophthora fragariae]
MHAVLLESVDNHVLLGYTLSTKLQRSDPHWVDTGLSWALPRRRQNEISTNNF